MLVTMFVLMLAIYLLIGFYFWRKGSSVEGFYVANRGGSLLLMTGTITASWASVVGFVGFTGYAWNIGFSPVTLIWSFWGYALIFPFVLGIPLRRFGGLTVPDFFGERFNSHIVRGVAAAVIVMSVGAYAVVQVIGMGIVLSAIGIPYVLGTTIAIVVAMLYIFLGGMWAVIVTETVQFLVFILAGFLLLPAVLMFVGDGSIIEGFRMTVVDLPAQHPQLFCAFGGVGFGWVLANNLAWNLGIPPMPHLITRAYVAKNTRILAKAICLCVTIGIPWCWVTYFAGTAAKGIWATKEALGGGVDSVMPMMVKDVLPPWLGALVLAGVMAVALSTFASQVPQIAFGIVRDVYQKIFNPNVSEKSLVILTRVVVLILTPIFVVIALQKPTTIMMMGAWAAAVSAGAFLPAFVAGIYWRRASKGPVLVGMVVSAILSLGFTLKLVPLPFGLHMIYWETGAAILLIVVLSYFIKPSDSELKIYDELHEKMSMRDEGLPLATRGDYGVPIVAIVVSLAFLFIFGGLLVGYPGSKIGWDIFWSIASTQSIPVLCALIIMYRFKKGSL